MVRGLACTQRGLCTDNQTSRHVRSTCIAGGLRVRNCSQPIYQPAGSSFIERKPLLLPHRLRENSGGFLETEASGHALLPLVWCVSASDGTGSRGDLTKRDVIPSPRWLDGKRWKGPQPNDCGAVGLNLNIATPRWRLGVGKWVLSGAVGGAEQGGANCPLSSWVPMAAAATALVSCRFTLPPRVAGDCFLLFRPLPVRNPSVRTSALSPWLRRPTLISSVLKEVGKEEAHNGGYALKEDARGGEGEREASEERMARKQSERRTYLIAAMMSSLGITSMAVASVYYRFSWQMEVGRSGPTRSSVGMEFWARWAHRALWHASLWHMHESHHRPRDGPFELNDVFAIINAVPAISLMAYGFLNRGLLPGLCFGAVSLPARPPVPGFFDDLLSLADTNPTWQKTTGPRDYAIRNGLYVRSRRAGPPPVPRGPHRQRAILPPGRSRSSGNRRPPAPSKA
ncbi:hypothetical protein BHM03_00018152 [Ensete ventricosum]|nr:hypothetical protein BHM03_00018152 [Ensete ventricosum]